MIFTEIADVMKGEPAHRLRVKLNPSHRIYEGHFAGQPIVPGSMHITNRKDCASKLSGKEVYVRIHILLKVLIVVDPMVNG